ncbi:MAG: radical SAM protein [Phycisphaerales bacterium]|nr:MAG: radical SAM protein [Phycisphaerales bacterium]
MRKLPVPEPVSAGLVLSYKCSSDCKHCMYACSPKWNADWIREADVRRFLSQLSGRIKPAPYGPDTIDLNSGLHFTGGEPFLNFELLLRAVEIAREVDIPSTFVETNCFWCANDDVTEARLRQLKETGLGGIMVSVNPFILESVPFERTERAARIGRDVFGRNAIVYQNFFYRQFTGLGVTGALTFESYLEKAGMEALGYAELIPMGRLPFKLSHLFARHRPEVFFDQSCDARLTSPHHIHVDNYGNYIGGFCAGISLGDAHDLESIFEGVDLDGRPILLALTTRMEKLYKLAKESAYEDLSDGYVSACHLCLDIRRHLVRQTDQFEELRPTQFYSHI